MKPDGFILGLSTGTACIATCAPILIPYLLGEGKGILGNYGTLGRFLLGRLFGYLLFAVLAWTVGSAILQEPVRRSLIIGMAYILFSGLLIVYGFFKKAGASCKGDCDQVRFRRLSAIRPSWLPVAAGFATALSFCPPFLLAFTGAADQAGLAMSLLFFFSFFLGTSLWLILVPFIGAFRRFAVLQTVGKMAAGSMGIYYLYTGSLLLTGGLKLW
ncbi:MAG: sulfite exporter TauE/SafE family protein [Deltaproteobacteria bacterium]|nr:sulfite exporter TauE/SafE family protein [Deltaproteobacteria bacterium]